MPTTKSNNSLLVQSFLAADRKSIFIATISSVVGGACSAALIAFIAKQFNSSEIVSANSILLFVVLLSVAVLASLFASKMLITAASLHSYNLRLDLCRRVLSTPFHVIEKIENHRLIASLTEDLNSIAMAFSRIPTVISNFTKVFFCGLYLVWLSPISGLLLLAVLLPVIYVQTKLLRQVKAKTETLLPIRDQRFGFYQVLTSGIKELNINLQLRREFYSGKLQPNAHAFRKALQDTAMANEYAAQWGQSAYFVIVFGLIVVVSLGFIEGDIIAAFALIGLYIRSSVNGLLQVAPVWIKASTAMSKIDSLGLFESDPQLLIDEKVMPIASDHSELKLELQEVYFRYERKDIDDHKEIGPFNLELHAGELVFITGGNGSGKTTLVKLLTALYKPSSGTLLLNSQIVNDEHRDWYKNNFYVVFSDYCLFDFLLESLEKNKQKRLDALLKQLQLDDQDTTIMESGNKTNLSVGQQARLALIPALLSDKPVLIFDEWAANQDLEFKRIFYYQLLPELKKLGKIVIVVSHDDRFFDIADRVVKLDNGLISGEDNRHRSSE